MIKNMEHNKILENGDGLTIMFSSNPDLTINFEDFELTRSVNDLENCCDKFIHLYETKKDSLME